MILYIYYSLKKNIYNIHTLYIGAMILSPWLMFVVSSRKVRWFFLSATRCILRGLFRRVRTADARMLPVIDGEVQCHLSLSQILIPSCGGYWREGLVVE